MAYQISYSGTAVKQRIEERSVISKSLGRMILTACICLAAVIALNNESVQQFLIPGDNAVTKEAFYVFVEELRNGEDFPDAATAFCREIIDAADIE